jgi:hypothetical protein
MRGLRQRSPGHTGLSDVLPDCPVCHERQKRKEITHCSLFGGAPDCPVRPQIEGNYGLPNGAPTTPSCLRAIKGTPRRLVQNTKHLLNIVRCRDFAFTHLVHCDRDSSTFLSCNSNVLLSCSRSCLVFVLLQLTLVCVGFPSLLLYSFEIILCKA